MASAIIKSAWFSADNKKLCVNMSWPQHYLHVHEDNTYKYEMANFTKRKINGNFIRLRREGSIITKKVKVKQLFYFMLSWIGRDLERLAERLQKSSGFFPWAFRGMGLLMFMGGVIHGVYGNCGKDLLWYLGIIRRVWSVIPLAYVILIFWLFPDHLSVIVCFILTISRSPEALKKREREIEIVKMGKKNLMYPDNVTRMLPRQILKNFLKLFGGQKNCSQIPGEGIIAVLNGMIVRPEVIVMKRAGSLFMDIGSMIATSLWS